ncbi:MAG: hypothetical protein OXQ94_17850 [Gemmatimonadota bacterium]|nr:hypothetical protein [Gemmatimonadota bacterium]MDE2873542.1 hypothetical protein [Gemmatimonadota bacterium]
MKARITPALVAILILAACGDSTKPPEFADLSGTLNGTAEGTAPRMTFSGTSSFTVSQKDGALTGTATLKGELSFGGEKIPFDLPGLPFTGTVAKGEDPKVDLKLPGLQCQSTIDFTGSYASNTKELSLTGSIGMFDDENCQKIVDLSTTLKLKK